MKRAMLFDGWASAGRTLLVAVLAYVSLVLLLRVWGKATLAKLNAFDFIVTIALGPTVATVLLLKDVSLASGVSAPGGLQYVVAWLAVRSAAVRRLVRSQPWLLMQRGRMLDRSRVEEQVSRDKLLAAVRSKALCGCGQASAVIRARGGARV